MGDDLQALLDQGMEYHEALQSAIEVNFGLNFTQNAPDPACVMFEMGGMQATNADTH